MDVLKEVKMKKIIVFFILIVFIQGCIKTINCRPIERLATTQHCKQSQCCVKEDIIGNQWEECQ